MAQIDVISSCSFGMATNATSSHTRIELTPLDLRILPYSPIQDGLLYHKPQSQDFEFKTFILHIKKSLSRTLDFFPLLAGRLGTVKKDDIDNKISSVFLDCDNAGVKFTHAIARGVSVSDILEPTYVPEIVSSFFQDTGLTNYEAISNYPLLAVQVTELVDGYFVGCTANHAVVDGSSFWHFLNSWAEISRGCDSISKNPVFERSWFPSNNINIHNFTPVIPSNRSFSVAPPPVLLDRVFHFSRENVAKLKAKANLEAGTDKIKISSLQSVSAHLWRSLTRIRHQVRNYNDQDNQISYCFLAASLRGRIPNFPDGYFGNTSFPAKVAPSVADVLSNGLGWAALKLNEIVAQLSCEKAAVEFLEEWVKKPNVIMTTKRIDVMSVTNSPRFDVYGNDFGWGKPVATRSGATLKSDGAMIVFPAASGGLQVLACLDPQVMRALGEDSEFMEVVTN